ncbi:HAMP domain-containing histidine kinase [Nocardioides sp. TRM66260-LWL]|uniref:sensor histidine kinase n=1 Tax=Nocardioides sp. TRM66260-LWL TaxID=2874478 RepID=UPI001CC47FF9|nr:HAMP domain-containing sensor histidine kinase [Nocardioides sp. TRM66260-LWL]MBZ5734062.1 HAMP domain-containing histidine kinase [Nocardioides sp. TRM66260-LWL]
MARTPRRSSLRGQIVLTTLGLTTLISIAVVLGVQLVLARTATRDIGNVLTDRTAAVQAVIDANSTATPSADLGRYLDPGVRIYDDRARLVTGSIEAGARDAADELAQRLVQPDAPSSLTVKAAGDLRLRAQTVQAAGGWRGVAVVSQATDGYERSEDYALLATIAAGVALVAVSGAVATRVTASALRPVTRMAALATEWSEQDLSRRFDLGPATDELARLGASLDTLLDRVADALRAEQRLTSELAHELRTPLTAVLGIAELAEMRAGTDPRAADDFARIADAARTMSTTITTLLDVARRPIDAARGTALVDDDEPAPTASVAEVLAALDALRAAQAPGGVDHLPELHRDVRDADALRVALPVELAVRCLAPVVDNALRHARHRVELRARAADDDVLITVRDDGDGVEAAVADRLFDAGVSGAGSTGLGLAVARRVANAVGGSVELASARPAVFEVRLPRA